MSTTPRVEPISIKEYTVRQSKYESVRKLPIHSIISGPSGSGKTVLLQTMILDIYKDCCIETYIFNPSIYVDYSWLPVQTFTENEMEVKLADDAPIFCDHYDAEALRVILKKQHKQTE